MPVGQNAAVRSLDSLLGSGLAIRVAVVPAPHDPDSFIKELGGEAFATLVRGAGGFFDYYLNRLCLLNDTGSDRGRQAVLRAMAEALHKTGSAVTLDAFAQKTALKLGVALEAVRAEFKKLRQAGPAYASAADAAEAEAMKSAETAPPTLHESWLLKLLLMHDVLVPWAIENLATEWIEHTTS